MSSFPFHFPTTGPSRLPSQRPRGNFQRKTSLNWPPRTHLRNFPGNLHGLFRAYTQLPPNLISIMFNQPHSFSKIYPSTPPSTHPSYHPYQSPTITPSTRLTPTPSHTWAMPGLIGGISSPGCSHVSSRAQGLRRGYKPPNSYILSQLVIVVSLSFVG